MYMFNRIATAISRSVQNAALAAQGISCCAHCKNRWGVVEGKTIPYTPGRGMFPICTECFDILDVDKIIKYVNELVDLWVSLSPDENYDGVREAAAQTVREMKAPLVPA